MKVHYPCDICDFLASEKGNLIRHHRSVHEKDKKGKHYCELCDYNCHRKDQLATHKLSAHERRKYEWKICTFQASIDILEIFRCVCVSDSNLAKDCRPHILLGFRLCSYRNITAYIKVYY